MIAVVDRRIAAAVGEAVRTVAAEGAVHTVAAEGVVRTAAAEVAVHTVAVVAAGEGIRQVHHSVVVAGPVIDVSF